MDEEEHKVVLQGRKASKPVNPAVWLGVMAVPLVLGLFIGLNKQGPDAPIENPRLTAQVERPVTGRMGAGVAVDNAAVAPKPVEDTNTYKCDFAPWVGLSVGSEMLDALKGAGRPHRVLEPGSAMTMDHSPARVNFDLDEAGTITRVWCG